MSGWENLAGWGFSLVLGSSAKDAGMTVENWYAISMTAVAPAYAGGQCLLLKKIPKTSKHLKPKPTGKTPTAAIIFIEGNIFHANPHEKQRQPDGTRRQY